MRTTVRRTIDPLRCIRKPHAKYAALLLRRRSSRRAPLSTLAGEFTPVYGGFTGLSSCPA
eukprot:17101-Prorocentrum_minimum.AAC.1